MGGRLYKSGDLARYRNDGTIEFLGRKDFQVQVRGFRVEVAEVETIFDELEGVRESAVMGQPLPGGGHRLVAYVVSATQPGPTVSLLRVDHSAGPSGSPADCS